MQSFLQEISGIIADYGMYFVFVFWGIIFALMVFKMLSGSRSEQTGNRNNNVFLQTKPTRTDAVDLSFTDESIDERSDAVKTIESILEEQRKLEQLEDNHTVDPGDQEDLVHLLEKAYEKQKDMITSLERGEPIGKTGSHPPDAEVVEPYKPAPHRQDPYRDYFESRYEYERYVDHNSPGRQAASAPPPVRGEDHKPAGRRLTLSELKQYLRKLKRKRRAGTDQHRNEKPQ